jgi:hypothetical protein
MSIRANVSILSNQITLIIKWMSIRANVSILSNQNSLIIKSFTRIFISNNFNYKMDEH